MNTDPETFNPCAVGIGGQFEVMENWGNKIIFFSPIVFLALLGPTARRDANPDTDDAGDHS